MARLLGLATLFIFLIAKSQEVVGVTLPAMPAPNLSSFNQSDSSPFDTASTKNISLGEWPETYTADGRDFNIMFEFLKFPEIKFTASILIQHIMFALESLVREVAPYGGNPQLPTGGWDTTLHGYTLSLRNNFPPQWGMTYPVAAAVLRGLWQVCYDYEFATFEAKVYIVDKMTRQTVHLGSITLFPAINDGLKANSTTGRSSL